MSRRMNEKKKTRLQLEFERRGLVPLGRAGRQLGVDYEVLMRLAAGGNIRIHEFEDYSQVRRGIKQSDLDLLMDRMEIQRWSSQIGRNSGPDAAKSSQ